MTLRNFKASGSIRNRGFTLLEVILVLVLISIFAAVAVVRQPSTDVTLKAGAERLTSHLRYAQMRAMNTSTPWGIGYSADSGAYWLFRESAEASANRRLLPGESQTEVDYLAQKSITIEGGDFSVSFDSWGVPDITAALVITLSKSGESAAITITPNTGYVH